MEAGQVPSATLSLRRPVGVTLGIALLSAASVAFLGEALSRLDRVRQAIPIQSVGSGQPQLDKKLMLLDDLVRKDGPLDCVFIGSSQVHRGIDPTIFEEAFRKASGRQVRSFNFGLGGLSETGEEPIATVLLAKFRPKMMIIGASSYGLDDERGVTVAAHLATNPWIQYHHGEFSFDGWLIEHSFAFRNYLGCLFLAEPRIPFKQAMVRRAVAGMSARGYGSLESGEFRGVDEAAAKILRNYSVSADHLESLSKVLRLGGDVDKLVVEVPVHESVIGLFQEGEADHQRALDAVLGVAAAQNVPFWKYPGDRPIPRNGWSDYVHLNRIGAEVYSRWLGERLGEAVRQGRVARLAD